MFKSNFQNSSSKFIAPIPLGVGAKSSRDTGASTFRISTHIEDCDDYDPLDNIELAALLDQCLDEETSMLELSSLEPSHIGPNGIKVVDKVRLSSASWRHDQIFISNLQSLLGPLAERQLSSSFESIQPKRRPSESSYDNSETSAPRTTKSEQWNHKLEELKKYRLEHGNCLVPLSWKQDPSLAHWVKRQRYQYSLKAEGKYSNMTPEREEALGRLGFVWDSHAAAWEEKWNELREFKERHGHCNVPTSHPYSHQLSVWVKCQRRQFKLLRSGKKSTMTPGRIARLKNIGFVFMPRRDRRLQGSGEV